MIKIESVELNEVGVLLEQIKHKDAEIEGKSYLLSMALDQIKHKDAEIVELEEIIEKQKRTIEEAKEFAERIIPYVYTDKFVKKAKAWLENLNIGEEQRDRQK